MKCITPLRAAPVIILGSVLLLAVVTRSEARSEAAFEGMAGTWAGEGSMNTANGATERLRCRSTDVVGGGGATVNIAISCKSDNAAFDLRVDATNEGQRIVGAWSEVTRGVQGGIEGQAANGRIEATAHGQGFSAAVAVATRGAQQSVTIRSASEQLSAVSMTLHRVH